MVTTLTLLAALSAAPGQDNDLKLTNVRGTYGVLGPKRTDKKVLPGDNYYLTFDIEGIKADADGRVKYSVSTEVTDKSGKVVFSSPAKPREALNALGGNRLTASANIDIGLNQAAGEYAVKVVVTDLASKKSHTLNGKFEVLPKAFGIARLTTSADQGDTVPCGVLGTGQGLWIHGAILEFGREGGGQKQPNVTLEISVLDEKDKPTLAKPFVMEYNKDVPGNAVHLPIGFLLPLNRAGKFTVKITATDKITNKTATQSIPIVVQESK
jgi:hypothetical protein